MTGSFAQVGKRSAWTPINSSQQQRPTFIREIILLYFPVAGCEQYSVSIHVRDSQSRAPRVVG